MKAVTAAQTIMSTWYERSVPPGTPAGPEPVPGAGGGGGEVEFVSAMSPVFRLLRIDSGVFVE